MSRYHHLTDEDRARIAETCPIYADNARELLLNVKRGKVARSGLAAHLARLGDFAVLRWQRNKSNFNFITGGNFNSVADAMKKAA